ncbi:hypothetical protein ACWGII_14485 [Streptomyces sp. NPDC054855]
MFIKRRLSSIASISAAVTLMTIPAAQATIISFSIKNKEAGSESSHWSEEKYTEVAFKNCNSTRDSSVDVKLWRAIDYYPDSDHGSKHYTACFSSNRPAVSSGEWSSLPWGSYYFELDKIDGGGSSTLSTETAWADTTKAD